MWEILLFVDDDGVSVKLPSVADGLQRVASLAADVHVCFKQVLHGTLRVGATLARA